MRQTRPCIRCGKEKCEKWIKTSYCFQCASEKARKWESENKDKILASVEKRRLKKQSTVCIECCKIFIRRRGEIVCSLRCKLLNEKNISENGCWIAPLLGSRGYGNLSFRGLKNALSHRISYKEFCAEIPDGMHVCHRCDTPACYNPEHLFLGTPKENVHDGMAKGRIKHIGAKGRSCRFTSLTEEQVNEMRILYDDGVSCKRLSRIFNCNPEYASKIVRKKVRF